MHDVFDISTAVPREVSGGKCTSYLHNYTSMEFFEVRSSGPFNLAMRIISIGISKGVHYTSCCVLLCRIYSFAIDPEGED